jgi:hypothetical protein
MDLSPAREVAGAGAGTRSYTGAGPRGLRWPRASGFPWATLAALGASDLPSVVIRQTLVQMRTPDAAAA